LDRLDKFHESHVWPNNMGLYELEETPIVLLESRLGFLPRRIEHIESFWLLPEVDHSSAGSCCGSARGGAYISGAPSA
jgi:hypothetical protein